MNRGVRFGVGSIGLGIYAVLALVLLLTPIAYTIAFSFNDSVKSNIVWRGFTFENWTTICVVENGAVCEAFGTSILVGVVATVAATALGTAIAIALVRYRLRFRAAATLLLFLPMATPEVVLGAGLAAQFLTAGVPKGVGTIILAHIMFCISFVVVTVRARVAGLDPAIEEAGRDLYASPGQVWWRITFPLLLPGIVSAALLSFALSFDDFIITNFNSGSSVTFPMFVWGSAQRGTPPQINVVGSLMFFISLAIVLLGQVLQRRRAKKA